MTSPFTQSDISRFRTMAAQGQRAQVYYEMGTRLINAGHAEAGRQMFFQASISSYSGSLGGAALLGNQWAKHQAPSTYPSNLDSFSLAVLNNVLDYMSADLTRGQDAVFTREEYFQIDYVAWRGLGVAPYFPGNYFRADMARGHWSGIPSDSIIYATGAFTPASLSADAWNNLKQTEFLVQVGQTASLHGDLIGLQADDWGFGPIVPGLVSSSGGFTGRIETWDGVEFVVVRRDDPLHPGNPNFGTVVNFYSTSNSFGDFLPDFGDLVGDALLGDEGLWDLGGDYRRRRLIEELGADPEFIGVSSLSDDPLLKRVADSQIETAKQIRTRILQKKVQDLAIQQAKILNSKVELKDKLGQGTTVRIAELAQLFGSTLGRQLAGDDLVLGTLSGSLLGTIGLNIGQQIDVYRNVPTIVDGTKLTRDAAANVWNDFPNELVNFTANAAIGSTSSWLALELGQSLGLKGFGAEMFSTGVGTLLNHTLNNMVAQTNIFNGVRAQPDWFGDHAKPGAFTDALGTAFVSFFATKLASMVVPPQTQAAVVLSSLGSAAGSAGGFAGGFIGNFAAKVAFHAFGKSAFLAVSNLFKLIPGVGIFIGFILGALIGNLFGRKKPRIPTANAEVVLQIPNAEYALGTVAQANGGNIDLVRAMGEAARDTLNGLISVVTYGDENARVSNTFSPTQVYGHTGGNLWVKLGGASAPATNVNAADEAVDKGATQIVGGDMLAKRAANDNATNARDIAGMSVAAA